MTVIIVIDLADGIIPNMREYGTDSLIQPAVLQIKIQYNSPCSINTELSSSQLLPKMHENVDFDIVSEFWKYGNLEM